MDKVVFENFSLPLPLEFYSEDCANATWDDIVDWQERQMRGEFARFGISYSVDKQSYIASITVFGKAKDSPKRCTTQFGKSALSAYQKLLYLVEYLNWGSLSEGEVDERIEQATLELKAQYKQRSK